MNRFLLYRDSGQDAGMVPGAGAASGPAGLADASLLQGSAGTGTPADSVRYGEYVLSHYGKGYRRMGDTGLFISGYVIPRNAYFQKYGGLGQHELISTLYSLYGTSFTGYIKGIFAVIILRDDQVEVFFDQAGLYRAFYCSPGGRFMIADTAARLAGAGAARVPDRVSLAMQALFHRVPGRYTVYSDIFKTTSADYFHLTGGEVRHSHYHTPSDLIAGSDNSPALFHTRPHSGAGRLNGEDAEITDFARLFHNNVNTLNSVFRPESTFITLTGGKDCRTILTALLGSGIKPEGITYGSSHSRDAVYASMVARAAGIGHTIIEPPATGEWFEREAEAITEAGDPEISIHRSHRRNAFAVTAETSGSRCAFYAGYMGGELLMGIYHDDLIFTGFLKKLWNGSPAETLIRERLKEYFIPADQQLIADVCGRMEEMACTDMSLPLKIREFHALFEIGVPHHSQDITLSSLFWDYPVPAFLDADFLDLLFRSRYSFLHRDANTVNPVKRHALFSLSMGIQHLLFPGLDTVPFGKRGFYNNTEYLRGPLSWSLVKGYRYLTDRKKYPSSFSYGREYMLFLSRALRESADSRSSASEFYDTTIAEESLKREVFPLQEKHLHRYSAIVTFKMLYRDKI